MPKSFETINNIKAMTTGSPELLKEIPNPKEMYVRLLEFYNKAISGVYEGGYYRNKLDEVKEVWEIYKTNGDSSKIKNIYDNIFPAKNTKKDKK